MTIEEITEWLWCHPPGRCDDVDAATRADLCEQIAELVTLVAQQERVARDVRGSGSVVQTCQ